MRQRNVGVYEIFEIPLGTLRSSGTLGQASRESVEVKRVERLYAVAEEIRRRAPQPVSASLLAERFGVTRRTMERDLAALRDAGVPLYASAGRAGGYGILDHGGRAVFSLSAEEVTALVIAVASAEGAPFSDAGRAASQRLRDALPAPTRVVMDQLVGRIRSTDPDRPKPLGRVQRTIEEAVRQGRVVNISYVDAEGLKTKRAVEAVGFYSGSDGWYLIGWCRLRDDRRLFRLDRIDRANLTQESIGDRDVDATLGWVPGKVSAPH